MTRFGLVGAGRWGQIFIKTLESLAPRLQLTHVATSKPHLAGSAVVVPHWSDLLSAPLDAIIVATPPDTHAAIVEGCVRAGKPCIVEKPLTMEVSSAEKLHALVTASGVPVLVDHTHLFAPAYAALRDSMTDAPRVILSEGMSLGPFRSVLAMWDWGPHDVSLCLDLVNSNVAGLEVVGGPDGDQVAMRLDFSNGVCAWIHHGRLSPFKRRTLSVFTDTRLFVWDDQAEPKLTVSTFDYANRYQGSTRGIPTPLGFVAEHSPLARMLIYFVDGLAGGDRSRFGTGLALQVTRLLAECQQRLPQKTLP